MFNEKLEREEQRNSSFNKRLEREEQRNRSFNKRLEREEQRNNLNTSYFINNGRLCETNDP